MRSLKPALVFRRCRRAHVRLLGKAGNEIFGLLVYGCCCRLFACSRSKGYFAGKVSSGNVGHVYPGYDVRVFRGCRTRKMK
jgi:hypothetical protein